MLWEPQPLWVAFSVLRVLITCLPYPPLPPALRVGWGRGRGGQKEAEQNPKWDIPPPPTPQTLYTPQVTRGLLLVFFLAAPDEYFWVWSSFPLRPG